MGATGSEWAARVDAEIAVRTSDVPPHAPRLEGEYCDEKRGFKAVLAVVFGASVPACLAPPRRRRFT